MENKNISKQNNQKGQKGQKKKKNSKIPLIFLGVMVLTYIGLYFIDSIKTVAALNYVIGIVLEILPILLIVYVIMVLFSLLDEKKLKQTIEKAPKLLKYILMSILGTISHGPIYAWYPFLKDLNEKGLSKGPIGTFLYSRGIKLTLIPMLVSFFDVKFVVILTITTLIFSVFEGFLIDASYLSKRN
ncbi:MAG: hypothetical protein KAG94_06180 [Clostridiales bacterium]|nr:hypothetical protein [Clostridiales bacterium]